MTNFLSVKDKVVIVTGAADGLGQAIAKCYGENGMKVIVSDINVEKGTQTELEIKELGGEVRFFPADVSDEAQVKKLINFAMDTYGRLDGIVNNAGISADNRPMHEYSLAEYERLMSINLKGVFLGMKYGIEAILKSKSPSGFVLNIASMAGIEGNSAMGAYVGSKHGAVGFTKTAALDYAKYNITVNAICPGTFRTSIWGDASEEVIQQYANVFSPNGRLGDSKEVGYLALFLASDLARYINGAVIPIDAGSGAGKITPVTWEHPEILE
ncbi:SDR family NAD(P)-dependent oxidoreductase [Saliterribacillus persicus]|uniref:NAD(P)-dependent dehydrogenase (Short-subunit alcohol dehydrogenase family) n=1 Tax=Saliterribacillus persicus TaxID=930114 RepID=A0A368YA43_9BACI|nr:SDR family NAD(P)-dependent oxidoreductase [Saliterribacillus persicus]RCW76995.1 NAD(P)-dependent dehydrogenase (short-subunit alcohol dehydrogenase family) [Saliterribacillus persicus]